MRLWLVFYAFPVLAIAISVSSNGNSPKVKMIGGMMVDIQQGFVPMAKPTEKPFVKSNYENSRTTNLNTTNLSINERYRRLIPYMTFYYANDLTTPTPTLTTEPYSTNVEVEKLHLLEAPLSERAAKKLLPQIYNVPRYQGNRLTHYNIASSNPGRAFKDNTYTQTKPAIYNGYDQKYYNVYNSGRHVQKQTTPTPELFLSRQRKPYVNIYPDNNSNVRYYIADKEPAQKYKLVPYDQTPPVKIITETDNIYEHYKTPSNEPLYAIKDVYVKPRPNRPQYSQDNGYTQQHLKKQPITISENYYEKAHSPAQNFKTQPLIEGGFKPIISVDVTQSTTIPGYMSNPTESPHTYYETQTPTILTSSPSPEHTNSISQPNYYQYVVDQPVQQPEYVSNTVTLNDLLHSLQKTKSIPKPITRENVGSSIKTLLQVLNALRVAAPLPNEISEAPILSTPMPFVATPKVVTVAPKPVVEQVTDDVKLSQEPYLAPVTPPSQHLDDFHMGGGSTQTFPLQVNSDDEGGTPGKPGVDYPILTVIPETSFDCKTQRYKGFFADPETRCQVWHYCDLNGGQASFLCPNGTIFSQAGLTCDWWFNVRCASTTQLYVLNESLYKYILPHSPKFPEDYSGPLVDKYLTLKFKEMEEQFRKNKNKQAAEKIDSDEEKDESSEDTITTIAPDISNINSDEKNSLSEVNIVVQSPGTSGNVERLQI